MNIWYRIWVYLLPAPMWLAELFMRTVMQNPDVHDFFPPSSAGIALGMIIPVLSPKLIQEPFPVSFPPDTLLVGRPDEVVRQVAMVTLFLGTLLWLATVFLSIGGRWPAGWMGESVDQKFWISAILYFIAFLLTEWKERL